MPYSPYWYYSSEVSYGPLLFQREKAPDGKHIAGYYWDAATSRDMLNINSFDGGEPERTFIFILPPGNYYRIKIRWTPDGKALTYSLVGQGAVSNIWLQPLAGGPARQLTNFTTDHIRDFDWTPDNQLILARSPTNQDIVLISSREPRYNFSRRISFD